MPCSSANVSAVGWLPANSSPLPACSAVKASVVPSAHCSRSGTLRAGRTAGVQALKTTVCKAAATAMLGQRDL